MNMHVLMSFSFPPRQDPTRQTEPRKPGSPDGTQARIREGALKQEGRPAHTASSTEGFPAAAAAPSRALCLIASHAQPNSCSEQLLRRVNIRSERLRSEYEHLVTAILNSNTADGASI